MHTSDRSTYLKLNLIYTYLFNKMTTKVHYFDGYGRVEPIRMLLVYCKIDFENINYTDETLPIAKASGNLEFGQLSCP